MITEKIYFKWNDTYVTGHADVDSQHQRLFELGNKLFSSDHENAKRYLMELYKYTRQHFEKEEVIMNEHNASNLSEHKKIHEELLDKLNDIANEYLEDSSKFEALKVFVYQWVTQHILKEDLDTWNKYVS